MVYGCEALGVWVHARGQPHSLAHIGLATLSSRRWRSTAASWRLSNKSIVCSRVKERGTEFSAAFVGKVSIFICKFVFVFAFVFVYVLRGEPGSDIVGVFEIIWDSRNLGFKKFGAQIIGARSEWG